MRLFKLDFFKHLHGIFWTNKLYVLEIDKLFERSALQQICLRAPTLSPVFAILGKQILISCKSGSQLRLQERYWLSMMKKIL